MKFKYIIQISLIILLTAPAFFAHSQASETNFQKIIGHWVRSDGGYILELKKIRFDGSVEAAYFNPNPINVSKAEAMEKDGDIYIYVELQDVGYPGSNYKLMYKPEVDGLVGIYHHSGINQDFDVFFGKE
jgi:hypothetical protein